MLYKGLYTDLKLHFCEKFIHFRHISQFDTHGSFSCFVFRSSVSLLKVAANLMRHMSKLSADFTGSYLSLRPLESFDSIPPPPP